MLTAWLISILAFAPPMPPLPAPAPAEPAPEPDAAPAGAPNGGEPPGDVTDTAGERTRQRARLRRDEEERAEDPRLPRESPRERGHKVAGVPAVRYEPSTGPQFGAVLQYVWRPPGTRLNKIGLLFLGHVSTKLLQDYSLRLSLRDLFGLDEQFIVSGQFIDDPIFPYAGTLARGEVTNAALVSERFYQAGVRTFGGSLFYLQPVYRRDPIARRIDHGGLLNLVAGYRMEADVIEHYEGSLLELDRPDSEGTTLRGSLSVGLAWDGRDNEASPTNGGLHDLTVEGAGRWTGATQSWARVNATARWYRPLHRDRLVFATRVAGDMLFGDAPLFAQGQFGGPYGVIGHGGPDLGRGFFRRRFIGDYKFFWTPELRGVPLRMFLFRWHVDVGLNAFADLGYVFSDEIRPTWRELQVSGGGGLFVNWDRFFVLRVEVAGSQEGLQVYLNAGHTF